MGDPPEDIKPVKKSRSLQCQLGIRGVVPNRTVAACHTAIATTMPIAKLDTIDMNRVPDIPRRFDQISRIESCLWG